MYLRVFVCIFQSFMFSARICARFCRRLVRPTASVLSHPTPGVFGSLQTARPLELLPSSPCRALTTSARLLKKNKRKQRTEVEDEDPESEDEDSGDEDDFEDDGLPKDYVQQDVYVKGDAKIHTVLARTTNYSRTKIDEFIDAGAVYINNERPTKKSSLVEIGDVLDILEGPADENPNLSVVQRLIVLNIDLTKVGTGNIKVTIRKWKRLLVDDYQ